MIIVFVLVVILLEEKLVIRGNYNLKDQTLIPFFCPAFEQSIFLLQNVVDFVSIHKFCSNWLNVEYQGWRLPAISEPHDWCGLWKTIGCRRVDLHEKLGKGRLTYVKQFRRSCYRASCKFCYTNWIARQANVSTRRIETFTKKSNQEPLHLILGIPILQQNLPVKLLRKRMSHILKLGNIHGCAVIFHPFKFNKKINQWYPSPHFHLVGFGNEFDIRNAFGRYGWYVKNKGERDCFSDFLLFAISLRNKEGLSSSNLVW